MHRDRFEQVAVLTFKRKSIVFPQNLPQAATFSENRTWCAGILQYATRLLSLIIQSITSGILNWGYNKSYGCEEFYFGKTTQDTDI